MPVIVFDLDGTLVDSVGDIAAALNAALRETGARAQSVDVVRGFVGHGARRLVQSALAAAGVDPACTDDVLARFQAHYAQNLVGETRAYDGVPAMLASLRASTPAVALGIATNKPGAFARPLVEALFPGVFAAVLGPDDVGTLKPDPAVVHAIARAAGGDVVAFVGDSGVDMETARNAGVRAVGVAWGLRPEELSGADAVARTPADLVPLLLRF